MKKNVLKKVFSIVIIVAMLLYYVPGECYADSQADNTDKREYIISTKNNNNKIVKLKKCRLVIICLKEVLVKMRFRNSRKRGQWLRRIFSSRPQKKKEVKQG